MNVTTRKVATISLTIFLLSSFAVIPLPYFITLLNINSANTILSEVISILIVGSLILTIVFSMISFKKTNNPTSSESSSSKRSICLVCGKKIGSKDVFCLNCGNKVT